jgi:hypothetical protein
VFTHSVPLFTASKQCCCLYFRAHPGETISLSFAFHSYVSGRFQSTQLYHSTNSRPARSTYLPLSCLLIHLFTCNNCEIEYTMSFLTDPSPICRQPNWVISVFTGNGKRSIKDLRCNANFVVSTNNNTMMDQFSPSLWIKTIVMQASDKPEGRNWPQELLHLAA